MPLYNFEEKDDRLYQAVLTESWNDVDALLLSTRNKSSIRQSSSFHSSRKMVKDLVFYKSEHGETPLHIACMNSGTPIRIIQKLYHSCPEAALYQDTRGETPVYLAAGFASDDVIRYLIRHCPPRVFSITNNQGEPPLCMAISFSRSPSIIEELLIAYPFAILHINTSGITPFQRFSIERVDEIRYLISNKDSLRVSNQPHLLNLESKRTKLFLETLILFLYHRRACACACSNVSQVSRRGKEGVSLLCTLCSDNNGLDRRPFLPLHTAIRDPECPWILVHLILIKWPEEGMKQDKDGNFPIHLIAGTTKLNVVPEISRLNRFSQKHVLSPEKDQLSLLQRLLSLYPEQASIPTLGSLKLPLILFIESTSQFQNAQTKSKDLDLYEVEEIDIKKTFLLCKMELRSQIILEFLRSQPNSLTTRDMGTHLYPFALAGLSNPQQSDDKEETNLDLNTENRNEAKYHSNENNGQKVQQFSLGFELLMKDPSVVKHSFFDLLRQDEMNVI